MSALIQETIQKTQVFQNQFIYGIPHIWDLSKVEFDFIPSTRLSLQEFARIVCLTYLSNPTTLGTQLFNYAMPLASSLFVPTGVRLVPFSQEGFGGYDFKGEKTRGGPAKLIFSWIQGNSCLHEEAINFDIFKVSLNKNKTVIGVANLTGLLGIITLR